MTNDTNTLNGALRELGETMAANLTTQGVASTWDEGLTTLAGKILDITPGPGPTPSFDGISLTGNKNILSAADSEYCVLSAQLTDSGSAAAVSGETVTFTVYKSSDDSVVTTLTDDTNSSGLATVSYYGNGTGDIYIKSSANSILSDPYSIEDCFKYDSASSNKTSDYSVPTGLSMSFSTDHYVISASTTQGKQIQLCSASGDFEVSALINTSNRNMGLRIGTSDPDKNSVALYGVSSGTGLGYTVNNNFNTNRTSSTISNNTWYKYTLKKENGVYTGIIETLQGTVFGTWTQSLNDWNVAYLTSAWNVSMQIKEIKVKAL